MPIYTWVEDNSSRGATIHRLGRKAQSTYRKSWKIFGTNDDSAVHDDVNTTLWQLYMFWQYPGQPQNRLHAESYSLEYLGDKAWQLEVSYVSDGGEDDEQTEPLKRTRSFDTGGGTQHVTQGLPFPLDLSSGADLPEKSWPNDETDPATYARYQHGAIGVDGDNVAGVDIIVPQLTWTETYDVPAQYVTTAYIKKLSSLTGTVNDDSFRGFQAGEVLFTGASGSQQWDEDKGDGPWSLSYKFVASANQGEDKTFPAITIGDIEGIEKHGHDYLWVRYEDVVDDNTLLKKPKAVYVNRVYRWQDFEELGIGVD
jgi:hypothetical protein